MKDRAKDPDWQQEEYRRAMGEEALRRQLELRREEEAREKERKKLEKWRRG